MKDSRPGLVAVCSSEKHTAPRFAACFQALAIPEGSCVVWRMGNAWDLAANRNALAGETLRSALAWLWMIDDDAVFPADILVRLLAHEREIVAPLVTFRKPPFDPIGMAPYPVSPAWSDEELVAAHVACLEAPPLTAGLVEAGAVGAAGMLVSADVLKAMGPRPFEFGRLPGSPALEDFWFCAKARRLGFKVWRDNSTALGHLTSLAVWPSLRGYVFDFDGDPTRLQALSHLGGPS